MIYPENPKICEVLKEVEEKLLKSKRVTKCDRHTNKLGNDYLVVISHGEEFLVEIDDYRQYIRVARRVDEPARSHKFEAALENASSVCYQLGVW